MKPGILLGYFNQKDEARLAARRLRREGYNRVAWIHKDTNGKAHIHDPLPWRRIFGLVSFSLIFGFVAVLLPEQIDRLLLISMNLSSYLSFILAGGLLGSLFGLVLINRSNFGVDKRLIEEHIRWLSNDETVLILQAPIEKIKMPSGLLLENTQAPPTIFVLHPKRNCPIKEDWVSQTPLTTEQLQEQAQRLAESHEIDPRPLRDVKLLKRLEQNQRWVHRACLDLAEANRLEQSLPSTAEWLLDNEYILESNARDVQLNLPKGHYQRLPALKSGPFAGLPRIYGLVREFVSCTDFRLDEENILSFFEAYQNEKNLSIAELWTAPQMLRAAIIESIRHLSERALTALREGELADFWAHRLIAASRRDTKQLYAILAELTEKHASPSLHFGAQLIDCLYDEGAVLTPVQNWLENTFHKSFAELSLREKNHEIRDQISIGNAFTSLRQLALIDWKVSFEKLSVVEKLLREDPADVYPKMDFATRDRYRRAVEELHRGSGLTEEQVARNVINQASLALSNEKDDERPAHVGTYLIGEKRNLFSKLIGCQEKFKFRFLNGAYAHHLSVYFLGLAFFFSLFLASLLFWGLGGLTAKDELILALLLILPVSQLALDVLNDLITRLFPPRALPKMDYRISGIPDSCQTLVVVPMMLTDLETLQSEADKLEVRFLANREHNIFYGLLSDFADAATPQTGSDAPLLKAAIQAIEALNQRYGAGLFFLFHRERKWSESEQKFICWERKRGKLTELNDLITGARPHDAERFVYVGDPNQLTNVRFVITLDSDTQLPHDTARRMIETLSHPLNQLRFDSAGRVLPGTFILIQPRVTPSLPSASGSPFSRLFSNPMGIDPYTNAVSDVYQDLVGEGSYHGKGIYDVRAFSRVLSKRFPEACLLSHDLIEGAHVRVAYASDIELFDDFPSDYFTFVSRQHRWIRGDWQIADWVTPRVPGYDGHRTKNPLSLFNRWKVFDNLRRSLLPVSSLALLLVSWSMSHKAGIIASAFVLVQFIFHSLVQHFTWATSRRGFKSISLAKILRGLTRVIVEAALLPYQAWMNLDAIVRSLYRRLISHRHLLEWATAQKTQGSAQEKSFRLLCSVSFASAFSVLLVLTIRLFRPDHLILASPWLGVWFFSPFVAWLLNRHPRAKQPAALISGEDRRFLRQISRRTWRYFSDFVNEKSSWLPPDNYQVSHQNQLAMRSSPTNIGLLLVSVLSAHQFGYVTTDDVVHQLSKTFESLCKLERYEGHLLNWYDIKTLAPLNPRYVSTADSGNFLGALWTLKNGLGELVQAPLLDARAFEGLCDTCELLKESAQKEPYVGFDVKDLDAPLLREWKTPHTRVVDALATLWKTKAPVRTLAQKADSVPIKQENVVYWAGQLENQIKCWLSIADRYLGWIQILNEIKDEELLKINAEFLPDFQSALSQAPTLFDLAKGNVPMIRILDGLKNDNVPLDASLHTWIDRVLESFSRAKWLAGEMLCFTERLINDSKQMSESINMRFLYNSERKLFSIGYNVSEGRLDRSFYDLLASEARLGSFIAIARGDVPVEHWFDMTRPYGAIGRRRVLLSWTGTMFEYLMPLLFQRSYWNTLLDQAAHEAVDIQIAYAHKHRVPWGISESAFGDLDIHKTYQYYAFGVPSLSLKRGQEEKIVIAPYATFLAIGLAPEPVIQNLKRLAELGLLSDQGYFESIDFSRQTRRGGRGVIVRAYMAHHQGMSFLSLTNFLHNNPLQRYFHADQRVRTAEPLLHERIPVLPTVHHISTRERVSSIASVGEIPPTVSRFDTPHTGTPKTQLFSNGRYAIMLTNSGGGYSRWGDFEITRWRSDLTRDSHGTFCYLHDVDSNQLWCNTYHPTDGKVETYQTTFTLDRAVFQRTDHDIETETEMIVVPEDDAEIRRLTLINRSSHTRKINLTSYIELSLAPHNADRQHPAFNKLFIQTELVRDHQAIIAHRRARSDGAPSVYVAHSLTLEQTDSEPLRFETDRRQFIGRGRTLSNPMGAQQELNNSQGFVLDPILSLRKGLVLGPGQRVQVSLVLAAAETRALVLNIISKYSSPHAIEHTMDLVWAAAQVELRLLRIQADEARRFQQLAGHLLYPNPLLRSPAKRIMENLKGQSGLWAYGISGDLPLVLVIIGEAQDLSFVRQILQAHNYWRLHGLKADLVIINEEANSYEQPLREKLEHLILTHATSTGTEQPGGVYLRSADLIPKEDLILMQSVAHVVMVAARGALPQQMGVAVEAPDLPKLLVRKLSPRDHAAALPFLELNYFNSLGGFSQDGREYAIYLGPDLNTPAPWVNVIANPMFGTVISETGAGFTWHGNSQRNRLTEWSNDPVVDPSSEALYIRDEETGRFWTPTASPIREQTAYRARHGTGYTVFEHNCHGINQELTVFVPMNDRGGEPVKLQRIKLLNDSGRPRRLSLTYYVELTLGETRESSQMHVITQWDDDLHILTARNSYNPDVPNHVAFVAFNVSTDSYTGDRTVFLGRNRSLKNPLAMERVHLSRRVGTGLDPCAALQVTMKLAQGEQTEFVCLLGQTPSTEQAHALVASYRKKHSFEKAFTQTKNWWDQHLSVLQVQTPELSANLLINRWLLYQTLSCRIWARSAFYQSGGAFGFRDQLQDVMALLSVYPALAREHILLAASRQFKEGDVQHWWHSPGGAGIRSRISDDLLWLPYVVSQYVQVTGDHSILNENISFLDAPELESNQHELFLMPQRLTEQASLFEHCERAVKRSQKYGDHGLPLIGTGDWNDGMNKVGASGKGESVWLAWFLADVLQRMADLSLRLRKPQQAQTYLQEKETLVQNIEGFAWDGEWYLRATFDDGSLLGSKQNTEAKIDSLPQSWARLSGAAQKDRAAQALESAWKHLVKEDEGLILLFTPPFDESLPSPGYIKGYPPGVRENGGQYTHAALWLAMALAQSGDGDRAGKLLRLLNPIEHAREPADVWRYAVEPYVMAADVYQLKTRVGMGGWSWYTGSAAWMYRAWVEECLGLKIRGNTLQINPVIPKEWDGFQMTYHHAEALYEILVENPDHCEKDVLWVELDGQRVKNGIIALDKELIKHKVVVRMGKT